MKTTIMLAVLKKELEERKQIKNSLIKSNDVGILAKQYFLPIIQKEIDMKIAKIKGLEKVMFFYDKEELNESN